MEDFAVCTYLLYPATRVCAGVPRVCFELDLTSFHQNVEGLLGIRTCLVTICSRIRDRRAPFFPSSPPGLTRDVS